MSGIQKMGIKYHFFLRVNSTNKTMDSRDIIQRLLNEYPIDIAIKSD